MEPKTPPSETQKVPTLKEIAAAYVARSGAPRHTLTEDARNLVWHAEFRQKLAEINDPDSFNPFYGWSSGLNYVLQVKAAIVTDVASYERGFRAGEYGWQFPRVSYMLWYLSQEADYLDRYPQTGLCKQDDYN